MSNRSIRDATNRATQKARTELNWARTYAFKAERIVYPESIEQVQEIVESSVKVRALGTRHSFNDLADTTGTLITVTSVPSDIELDEVSRTVTVGAGTRYGVLAAHLRDRGWALHNLGSLPHISVGGAISTGTHGSGNSNGNLAAAVRALEFVGAGGVRRTVAWGDPDFSGSVIALGALGILVRVTLAIEPAYSVRQDVYRGLEWDQLLGDLPATMEAGYSVSIFTDWVTPHVGHAWVKRRVDSKDSSPAQHLFGAVLDPLGEGAAASHDGNLTEFGTVGPWSERLPHFKLDSTPSVGAEIQTEYFVDLEVGPDALKAVRKLGPLLKPHLIGTEIRTVAADDLWLSPSYDRAVLGIHFTWKQHTSDVLALLPLIEDVLSPFDARTHWGKLHRQTVKTLAPLYPRFDDMRSLIARTDPEQIFHNDYLDRVLGPR